MSAASPPVIGLLGGSFDPIHNGHLALAHAAIEQLQLDSLHLIPAGQPWQRKPLQAGAQERLAMVQLAIADDARMTADNRELVRSGPTFTYDTLHALRQELGSDAVLVWIIGSDQLDNLPTWHRLDDLFALAHFAVTQRAGATPLEIPAALKAYPVFQAHDSGWRSQPYGSLIFFPMPPVNLSATQLRDGLAHGSTGAGLVPAPVLRYIEQHQLYR